MINNFKDFVNESYDLSSEKTFNTFKKTFKENIKDNEWYKITYFDKEGEEVGEIEGSKFKNFTTVEHIRISPKYQGSGYSKFLYRDVLKLSKERKKDGLMVGGQLLQSAKTRTTYNNFKYYEYELKNEHGEPYIILTDWIN
jgi:hypothetical protein